MEKTLLAAAVAATLDQTRAIERGVTVMGLEAIAFEDSDSLVAPASIAR
jgi:putative iron-regulated protein